MAHSETCLRSLLSGMDIIMHVQIFFYDIALVIGTLIAEVIEAFWAMGTT